MYFSVTNDNQEQKVLDEMRAFQQELKKKKKKLDQKTKFKKALRGIDNNKVKGSHGHKAHGGSVVSGSSKAKGKGSGHDVSFMYAMVLAIVAQMNTNLKSMGVQAQHVQILDANNNTYNEELKSFQEEANSIKDYTSEGSLEASSQISAQMNILGNNLTENQQEEMKDTGITQGFQTNNSSESALGQSMLDLDKQIFRQVHFRKG